MRLFEHESKKVFKLNGIPVPENQVVESPDEITIDGPAVLKVQIPSGGRKKAGGVLFSQNKDESRKKAAELIGKEIKGFKVKKVLVENQLDIDAEYFMAVTYDSARQRPVVIFSREGGIDIEELAEKSPEKIVRRDIDTAKGVFEHQMREVVAQSGADSRSVLKVGAILYRLVQVFMNYDATLAEINPLVRTKDGNFIAVDGHMEIDDDALYRQKKLIELLGKREESQAKKQTEFEKRAAEIDELDHRGVAGRMIEFDGNLGLLIGGGGASLTSFDAIRKHGGKPANYCEIGGNPSVFKVQELVKLILSRPGIDKIAVIMNVVSNTRVDLVARGVIKGVIESGKKPSETITVFRIPGAWEDEGFKILKKYGVQYCDRTVSIDEAAKIAVQKSV
ncbi:MAG: hypothetical protein D6734_12915 [Candidatus Schekmanbacteria bacterium]|nr:MAG: hypothetical protein D6734_12915 [Candidatus Schekmanbacteria bacterium]